MIPALTEQGFLPPGIHQATLAEFKERFVVFQRSDRRFRIFANLETLVDQAARSGIVKRIIMAGSFVTAKPEPNDFDCIVVLDPAIVGQALRPFEYRLVSRQRARRMFGGDVMPALDNEEMEVRATVEFDEHDQIWLGQPDWSTRRDLPLPR